MGQVRPPESFHVLSFEGEMYGESHWSQRGGPPPYQSGCRAPGAREGAFLRKMQESNPYEQKVVCIPAFVF